MKVAGIIVLLVTPICLLAQNSDKQLFIGFQPSITKEKHYAKEEFDVNLLPMVLQRPIGSRINLRLASILNYHFGGEQKISDVGISLATPVYLIKMQDFESKPFGFYLSPVLALGKNFLSHHYTSTLAVEPGYMFKTSKRFTVNLGIQYGTSYFIYKNSPNKQVNHFGVKVSLGFWL